MPFVYFPTRLALLSGYNGENGGGQALKRNNPFRRELAGKALVCASRLLLTAVLSGAEILGGYAPFAVGAVAASGPGWEGFSALAGAVLGALLFLDFSHALRTVACCVLIYTANNAFCELGVYRSRWFRPALTAGLCLTVEFVYVLRSGSTAEAAGCALSLLLSAGFTSCGVSLLSGPDARRDHPAAALVLLTGVLTALSSAQLQNGVAPGRVLSSLAVLLLAFDRETAPALLSALCIGLGVDLAAGDGLFVHTACYVFCAAAVNLLRRGNRVRSAGVFALSAALFALPLSAGAGLALLYEGLAGTLVFLLLPARSLRALHAGAGPSIPVREEGFRRRLSEAAAALRELYDGVTDTAPPAAENPAVIFDRAAEKVCRDCALRSQCWEREYNRTYNALNDATAALLRNGEGRGEDFPGYFSDRCIRFPSFLGAVNGELSTFLLRRQYRGQLSTAHARAAGQYAQLSELLYDAAARPAAETDPGQQALPYRIGISLRPKAGEAVSGDCASTFETEGTLCLLLSDGMGSGEGARKESALAVRLLERFLRAGIDATPALKTLNSALNLRSEVSDTFTTIDLLTLSLGSGEGELYKYGAAPSYIKRGRRVRRVSCACLPAGLEDDLRPPETTHIRLDGGSYFVMVTDGVADALDDAWLLDLLSRWEGDNPQMLSAAILADSLEFRGQEDDAGVLVLYLPEEREDAPREV